MLILTDTDRRQPAVADVVLGDDRLIEVSPKEDIVWDWIPQLTKPSEQRVTPPPLGEFKVASSDQQTR